MRDLAAQAVRPIDRHWDYYRHGRDRLLHRYWLLLRETVHKKGPTFCPDCGRLVTAPSAIPQPGDKPPPTKAEYESRKSSTRMD